MRDTEDHAGTWVGEDLDQAAAYRVHLCGCGLVHVDFFDEEKRLIAYAGLNGPDCDRLIAVLQAAREQQRREERGRPDPIGRTEGRA